MKTLLRLAFALGLLAVLCLAGLGYFADGAARAAIERGGSYALGVKTTLDSADLGLLSGEFGLSGLAVENPEGFGGEHFLTLGEGSLELSLGDMSQDEVRVPQLALSGVFVDLERKGGKTNYGVILENLERFQAGGPSGDEDGVPGPSIVFDRIVITDVEARVSLIPIGGGVTQVPVHIDEIVLEDVGADGSGVTVSQAFDIVLRAVLTTVVTVGGDLIPLDLLEDLGGQLGDVAALAGDLTGGLSASVGGVALDLGEGLGGVVLGVGGALGDAGGAVLGGVGEGLGGAVEGIGAGLGGLFGGKKDGQ